MLEELSQYYRAGVTERTFPRYRQYVEQVHMRARELSKRVLSLRQITPTIGNQLLVNLIKIIDPCDLLRRGDDFYIYSTQVDTIIDSVKTIYNVPMSGKMFQKCFTLGAQNAIVQDYVLIPKDNDLLKFAPMGAPYQQWKRYYPLKLWYHDSPEQTLDVFSAGGIYRFHEVSPSFCVWMLDLTLFIVRTVAYFRADPTLTREHYSSYIRDEVLVSLVQDSVDLWFLKLHDAALRISLGEISLDDVLQQYTRTQTQYSYIGSMLPPVLREIVELYNLVKDRSMRPREFLGLQIFRGCTTSMSSLISEIPLRYAISHHAQCRVYRVLRDMPYMDYLIRLYTLANSTQLSYIKNEYHREIIADAFYRWKKFARMW